MRSAGNFSPEWGYLAPAPSFMRTARVVLVATAVGATAGAGVVVSLIDRPAADGNKTSLAAHALVTRGQAATPATMPLVSVAPTATTAAAVPANNVTASARPSTPVQTPDQATPQIQAAAPVPTQPPVAMQAAVSAPMQSTDAAAPKGNFGASESNAAAAPPMAALSTEAAPADGSNTTIIAPEPAPPQKKTKHAGQYAPNGKLKPAPGLGSVFRRLFSDRAPTPSRGL